MYTVINYSSISKLVDEFTKEDGNIWTWKLIICTKTFPIEIFILSCTQYLSQKLFLFFFFYVHMYTNNFSSIQREFFKNSLIRYINSNYRNDMFQVPNGNS